MSLSYANAINSSRPLQKYPIGLGLFASPVDVTFDSAFPSGGYAITAASLNGIFPQSVMGFRFIGWKGGSPTGVGRPQWDATNGKMLIDGAGTIPAIIIEEVVTVTSNAGRLARVPGYILAVQGLTGTTTGAFRVIPTGKTPVTKQVAVNFATGALATLSTDVVGTLAVTYIPLGVGQFTSANLVVDEAVTLASGGTGVDLANRAAVIQYVWNDTASGASRLPQIIPVGESPSSNQIAIDINRSGASSIICNSSQNTNSGLVTYFKYGSASAWVSNHSWTDQADVAVTSDAIALNEVLDIGTIWIPGYGNVIVGETTSGTTNLQSVIQGPRGAVAANVNTFDPLKGALAFANADAYVTAEMPYVLLSAANALGGGGSLQTGFNLSGVVGRFEFLGR